MRFYRRLSKKLITKKEIKEDEETNGEPLDNGRRCVPGFAGAA